MILKTPHGTPFSLFYLTSDMHRLLVKQSIPLRDVFKLASYHQKLTFGEIATMLRFQYTVAQQMGVPLLDPKHLFGEGYNGGMVAEAFNAIDSETLNQWYKGCKTFNSLNAGGNVMLVLFNDSDNHKVHGWHSLEGNTFSSALLETIFAGAGYMESHYGKIAKPSLGETTLAEVYKLVSIENP